MLDITLAAPQRHGALTLFPLVTGDPVELPYTLLVDALAAGTLKVTEVGEGTVPTLFAHYTGEQALLLLDGEQLLGARQNRMISRSLLLPGRSRTKVPVSCMEQGRWRFTSDSFAPSTFNSPAGVRRRARESEAGYAREGRPAPAEMLAEAQMGVWSTIAEQAAKLGEHTETGALNDLFTRRADELETGLKHFAHQPSQVGALAFVGAQPLGMDVIGGRSLYARLHERLLRGYLMDALAWAPAPRHVTGAQAQAFLDAVREAERVASPTVGAGAYRVLAGAVIGGELEDEGRIAHLSAFPAEERRGPQPHADPPLAPPSRRRR